jgi:two-component system OmpR family response regulator
MRLLLLQHDTVFGKSLRDYLRSDAHVVDWYQRLSDVWALREEPYDILLVQWQLPDGSGVDWVRALRRAGNATPALILTAPNLASERVRGLDSGADDYVVLPIARAELAARIRAVRRRVSGFGSPHVTFGPVELDLNGREASVNGTRVGLTAREWSILEALVLRTGRVVSKRELEALVLGLHADLASNSLEVHVSNLRRKLGRGLIETVRGIGYRMATEPRCRQPPFSQTQFRRPAATAFAET